MRCFFGSVSSLGTSSRNAFHDLISEDKEQTILFVFANATSHERHTFHIRALDLDPDAVYVEDGTGKEYTGDFLMNIGHMLTSTQEYGTACWVYNKKH